MFQLSAFADEAGDSLSEQISALRGNGIPLLEIRGVDGKNISSVTGAEAKEIRNRLDDAGISVWSVGSPGGKINLSDPFGPHLDEFRHTLTLTGILGASHYRLFSFYNAEGQLDEVTERLGKFCGAAEGSGVTLCHENEKGIYGSKPERCIELHRALPALRAVFDPANFVQEGSDPLVAWRTLEPYVEYLHIKDALADGTIVPAGRGAGRIPEILSELRGRDFTLSLEPHLSDFTGLSALERAGGPKKKYSYPSQRAAFDAAAAALREILTCH